jgi:site-specific DNA recombinase
VCGLSCLACRKDSGHTYYLCRGKLPAIQSCRDQKCPARYSPAQQLDDLVWNDLCSLLMDPAQIRQALERAHGGHWLPQELQARRDGLRRAQSSLEQQMERLTEAYLGGVVGLEEYRRRRQEWERRVEALAQQQRQLDAQADHGREIAGMAIAAETFCERVRTGLSAADFAQKRQLVKLLIDGVVVTNGEVEIRYLVPISPAGEQARFCQLHSVHRRGFRVGQRRVRAGRIGSAPWGGLAPACDARDAGTRLAHGGILLRSFRRDRKEASNGAEGT